MTSSARASSVGGMSRPSALAVLRLTTNWSTPAPERRHLNMVPRIRTRRQGSGQDSAEHFQHALNFCRSAMAAVVRSSTRYKRDHCWLTLMVKARRRPRNAPRLSLGAKRNAGAIAYRAIWVTLSSPDLQRVCTGPTQL